MPRSCPPLTPSILVLATLLLVPAVAATQAEGEFTTTHMDATGDAAVSGDLGALRFRHAASSALLAPHDFHLDASRLVVESDHADYYAQGNAYLTQPETNTLHDGAGTLTGTANRDGHRLWVLPLPGEASPTIEITHTDTSLLPPDVDELVLAPRIQPERSEHATDTSTSVAWTSTTPATATLRGDFLLVLWAWDAVLTADGQQTTITSGVQGPTQGQGAGSADEVWITAHDATLTLALEPTTYALFLDAPRLTTNGTLTLRDAQGRLSGLPQPLDGDVVLGGEFHVQAKATGVDAPLAATLKGGIHAASLDGAPVAITTPPAPGSASRAAWIASGVVAAVLLVWAWIASKPLRVHHALAGYADDQRIDGQTRSLRQRMAAGLYLMADRDVDTERFERALRRARRSLRWNPKLSCAAFVKGGALAALQRLEEARVAFQDSRRLATDNIWRALATMGEAEVAIQSGDLDAAARLSLQGQREHAGVAAATARGAAWNRLQEGYAGLLALLRAGPTEPDDAGFT